MVPIARLLSERGLLTEQQAVQAIVGEPVRGSWWGHPKGKEIFRALSSLEDAEVLTCKLVDGKQTFVHARLWPALVRLQRERALWPPLSDEAAAVLEELRRAGSLEVKGKPRLELERALRAVGRHEHTEKGRHRVLLVPFEAWVTPELSRAAAALSVEEAKALLAGAGFEPSASPKSAAPNRKRR